MWPTYCTRLMMTCDSVTRHLTNPTLIMIKGLNYGCNKKNKLYNNFIGRLNTLFNYFGNLSILDLPITVIERFGRSNGFRS